MRPLRFLLTVFTSLFAFVLLIHLFPFSSAVAEEDFQESSRIRAYFNWRTPSSLFPPSAVISLTDDNSTFFLARPAAFGPLLPAKSLSGQLWVGNGFDFDEHGRTGGGYGAGGELGCSDVPGWDINDVKSGLGKKTSKKSAAAVSEKNEADKMRRSVGKDANDKEEKEQQQPAARPDKSDGTDDHLHHPLPPSHGLNEGALKGKKPTHADIQSLQEGAEIAGKVVLLSRGGCGFLEKVKWVQRRGGVALIVGDDIRGGPLVTMYARGETSNITIPSLFTSHTTAHLLSSLVPSGRRIEDLSGDEAARLGLALGEGDRSQKGQNRVEHASTSAVVKPSSTNKARKDGKNTTPLRDREDLLDDEVEPVRETSWFQSLFGSSSRGNGGSRPPSSGNLLWVRQEEFEDDVPKHKSPATASTAVVKKQPPSSSQKTGPTDGFRIGVQDWRDPDLVAEQKEHLTSSTSPGSREKTMTTSQNSKSVGNEKLRGGSITPGSGEYSSKKESDLIGAGQGASAASNGRADPSQRQKHSGGWLSNIFASPKLDQDLQSKTSTKKGGDSNSSHQKGSAAIQSSYSDRHPSIADGASEHDGLWVTLTPTSMSSSPFFDTLLVLVVSPLVTLTVVYALLLLRSRIRRRRWRAPKSVVERLPVRTYQTMPSNSPSTASTTSSVSSLSATTPLLPNEARQGARPITARSRPRSRTTSEFQSTQAGSSLRSSETNSIASPSLEQMEEKRAAGLAEWRRRYGGKQRECVVCLEDYVDGVSRVMSLPCGHEFHEGCITPWLTTRRRTCPICKGDVVRSLARSGSSVNPSPLSSHVTTHNYAAYNDSSSVASADEGSERGVQEQAALTHNDDPDSQQPISREDEAFEDLERGVVDRNR
ncbi:hypothetical protein K431DRAFT_309805 [Polychaeton citri CBS 116435]|uniref:RING-type E3 ubiquitin transferase n=1 Tax=Polychaeton citri CBS 116435 TaxID=1314669 RepID=A0A9P4QFG9_9PEZI|nr:hypothetical protein K431DRAFT_309805 [Polychaeton citri CBS 116435]